VDAHLHQVIDRQFLEPRRLHVLHEHRRRAVDACLDQLGNRQAVITGLLEVGKIVRIGREAIQARTPAVFEAPAKRHRAGIAGDAELDLALAGPALVAHAEALQIRHGNRHPGTPLVVLLQLE
jgi:hypothetical protein